MFSGSDIGNRLVAAAGSLALCAVMMMTIVDYATPFTGGIA
ncbi:hypothetical protein [Altererythrobacter sp.]|jgi:hypothetical protein|nr:hypothetical protein [Altererythrobacter sp.]MDX1703693.1 hypothetical protein [Altererythrobacter ishigakiensis]